MDGTGTPDSTAVTVNDGAAFAGSRTVIAILVVALTTAIAGLAYEHHALWTSRQSFARELGDRQKTIEEMQATIQNTEAKLQLLEETAQGHYQRGVDALSLGQLPEAKAEFETVISKYPSDSLADHARKRLEDVAIAVAQQETAAAAENAHEAIPLFTAVQLGESARANFGRFESDFENKTVRFTGTIQDIGASSFRMHSVTEMYISVRDLPMSQLHDLSTGDSVEVTGSFTGDIDPRRGFDFPSLIFTGTEARKR